MICRVTVRGGLSPGRAGGGPLSPAMPTRLASGLQNEDGHRRLGQAGPPVPSLKGSQRSAGPARPGGNGSRIPGVCRSTSCRDSLGPQRSGPTPKPPSPKPAHLPISCLQTLQAGGVQEVWRDLRREKWCLASKPSANPESEGFLLCRSACVSGFPEARLGWKQKCTACLHSLSKYLPSTSHGPGLGQTRLPPPYASEQSRQTRAFTESVPECGKTGKKAKRG